MAFDLNANIILSSTGIDKFARELKSKLESIPTNVDIKFNRGDTRAISSTTRQIDRFIQVLDRLPPSATKASQALTDFFSRFNIAGSALNKFNTGNIVRDLNVLDRQVDRSSGRIQSFADRIALTFERFTAFTIVSAGIFGFIAAIAGGVKAGIDFERELIRVKQVSDASEQTLEELTAEVGRLGAAFGTSSNELIKASVTLSQAGFSADQTRQILETLALTDLSPTFDSIEQSTEGVIAVINQFGIGVDQLQAAFSGINEVAARFAVESSDIIEAVKIAGGVFASASSGISEGTDALAEFQGLITSVRQTTRQSANQIATALRTIIPRLQRPRTLDFLEGFGVELLDENRFVGPFEALRRISELVNRLPAGDTRIAQIIEQIAGIRQFGRVLPILQNFNLAVEAQGVALEGSTSLTDDATIAQEALAVQLRQTGESFLKLLRDVVATDTFQQLADSALLLANAILRIADAAKEALPVLALVFGIRAGQRIFGKGFTGAGTTLLGVQRGGIIPRFAEGGQASGLALLEPGEKVIRRGKAQQLGVDNLLRFNEAFPRFATGGPIDFTRRAPISSVPGTGSGDKVLSKVQRGDIILNRNAAAALPKFQTGGRFNSLIPDIVDKSPVLGLQSGTTNIIGNPIFREIFQNISKEMTQTFSRSISRQGISDELVRMLINRKQQTLQSGGQIKNLLVNEIRRTKNENLTRDLNQISQRKEFQELVKDKFQGGGIFRGIRAFHGTPHTFDKFDIKKIGGGEGGQFFGHGLYFTDNKTVAKFYRDKLSSIQFLKNKREEQNAILDLRFSLFRNKFPREAQSILDISRQYDKNISSRNIAFVVNDILQGKSRIPIGNRNLKLLQDNFRPVSRIPLSSSGNLYTVFLKPTQDEFIDLDKRLSEQSTIFSKLKEAGFNFSKSDTGTTVYSKINRQNSHNAKETISVLLQAGIRGNKFKSGQLSGIKDSAGTNYVVFDDSDIEILNRFARGGIFSPRSNTLTTVPGTGTGDRIFGHLDPNSVVINRTAVRQLGTDNILDFAKQLQTGGISSPNVLLEPGEVVVGSNVAKRIGPTKVNRINQEIPRFQHGGEFRGGGLFRKRIPRFQDGGLIKAQTGIQIPENLRFQEGAKELRDAMQRAAVALEGLGQTSKGVTTSLSNILRVAQTPTEASQRIQALVERRFREAGPIANTPQIAIPERLRSSTLIREVAEFEQQFRSLNIPLRNFAPSFVNILNSAKTVDDALVRLRVAAQSLIARAQSQEVGLGGGGTRSGNIPIGGTQIERRQIERATTESERAIRRQQQINERRVRESVSTLVLPSSSITSQQVVPAAQLTQRPPDLVGDPVFRRISESFIQSFREIGGSTDEAVRIVNNLARTATSQEQILSSLNIALENTVRRINQARSVGAPSSGFVTAPLSLSVTPGGIVNQGRQRSLRQQENILREIENIREEQRNALLVNEQFLQDIRGRENVRRQRSSLNRRRRVQPILDIRRRFREDFERDLRQREFLDVPARFDEPVQALRPDIQRQRNQRRVRQQFLSRARRNVERQGGRFTTELASAFDFINVPDTPRRARPNTIALPVNIGREIGNSFKSVFKDSFSFGRQQIVPRVGRNLRLGQNLGLASLSAGILPAILPDVAETRGGGALFSGIQGGLTTGAIAGLGFGPLGAAIGGTIGAFNSFTRALDEFDLQKATRELESSIQNIAIALDGFERNGFINTDLFRKFNNDLRKFQNISLREDFVSLTDNTTISDFFGGLFRGITGGPSNEELLRERIDERTGEFRQRADQAARAARTIITEQLFRGRRPDQISDDLLRSAISTNENVARARARGTVSVGIDERATNKLFQEIQKEIDARQKTANSFISLTLSLEKMNSAISSVHAGLGRLSDIQRSFDTRKPIVEARAEGRLVAQELFRQNPFEFLERATRQEIGKALRDIGVGGVDTNLLEFGRLSDDFNRRLLERAEREPTVSASEAIETEIESGIFRNLSQELKLQLGQAIAQIPALEVPFDDQGKPIEGISLREFLQSAGGDVVGTVFQDLSKQSSDLAQIFSNLVQASNEVSSRFVESINQRSQLEERLNEQLRNIITSQINVQNILADARGIEIPIQQRLQSQEELVRRRTQVINPITGAVELQGTTDPSQILNNLDSIIERRTQIHRDAQIDQVLKDNAFSSLNAAFNENVAALRDLSQNILGLSEIQSELARIQSRREGARQEIFGLFGAGVSELQQRFRNLTAFNLFQEGGLGGLRGTTLTRENIVAGFEERRRFKELGGATEQELEQFDLDFLRQIQRNGFPIPRELEIALTRRAENNRERELIGQLEATTQRYIAANEALAKVLEEGFNKFTKFNNERLLEEKNALLQAEAPLQDNQRLIQANERLIQSLDNLVLRINSLQVPNDAAAFRVGEGLQRGGIIPGFGSGDKIPVLAEPGEFFLNKSAVQALGLNNLNRLNKMFPRFQNGGKVGKISRFQIGGQVPATNFIRQPLDVRIVNINELNNQGLNFDQFIRQQQAVNQQRIQPQNQQQNQAQAQQIRPPVRQLTRREQFVQEREIRGRQFTESRERRHLEFTESTGRESRKERRQRENDHRIEFISTGQAEQAKRIRDKINSENIARQEKEREELESVRREAIRRHPEILPREVKPGPLANLVKQLDQVDKVVAEENQKRFDIKINDLEKIFSDTSLPDTNKAKRLEQKFDDLDKFLIGIRSHSLNTDLFTGKNRDENIEKFQGKTSVAFRSSDLLSDQRAFRKEKEFRPKPLQFGISAEQRRFIASQQQNNEVIRELFAEGSEVRREIFGGAQVNRNTGLTRRAETILARQPRFNTQITTQNEIESLQRIFTNLRSQIGELNFDRLTQRAGIEDTNTILPRNLSIMGSILNRLQGQILEERIQQSRQQRPFVPFDTEPARAPAGLLTFENDILVNTLANAISGFFKQQGEKTFAPPFGFQKRGGDLLRNIPALLPEQPVVPRDIGGGGGFFSVPDAPINQRQLPAFEIIDGIRFNNDIQKLIPSITQEQLQNQVREIQLEREFSRRRGVEPPDINILNEALKRIREQEKIGVRSPIRDINSRLDFTPLQKIINGQIQSNTELAQVISTNFGKFGEDFNQAFLKSLDNFRQIAESIKIPEKIELVGTHNHTVQIQGLSVLSAIGPEMQKMAENIVREAFRRYTDNGILKDGFDKIPVFNRG